jgi:LDH2 family malate/lactate/ureidoglycolate dehydrogenase
MPEFRHGVRAVLDTLKRVRPAPGADEVLVPSEPGRRARQWRLANGIDVPDVIWGQISEQAQRLGVSLDGQGVADRDLAPYQV